MNLNCKAFVLLFFLYLTGGCGKIENSIPDTIVYFQVVNKYSGQPIPNAQIMIVEWDDRKEFPDISILKKISVDDQGKGSVRFRTSNKGYMKYNIEVFDSLKCGTSMSQAIHKNKENHIFAQMILSSYVNYHLKNTNPFDNNDSVCFYEYNVIYNKWNSPVCYSGTSIDTFVFLQPKINQFGGNKIPVKYQVIKNNISTTLIDSIFINPCDTTIINVSY